MHTPPKYSDYLYRSTSKKKQNQHPSHYIFQKSHTQHLPTSKSLHLQKLRLNISTYLKPTQVVKNSIQQQKQISLQTKAIKSQSLPNDRYKQQNKNNTKDNLFENSANLTNYQILAKNFNKTSLQHYHPHTNSKQKNKHNNSSKNNNNLNLYKINQQRHQNLLSMLRNTQQKFNKVNNINSQQQLRNSNTFLIKQIKPQPKTMLHKNKYINVPNHGRTFGSYYQIVALNKKFYNSKYFNNEHPQYPEYIAEGNALHQRLDQRYRSRISSKNYGNQPNINNLQYQRYQQNLTNMQKYKNNKKMQIIDLNKNKGNVIYFGRNWKYKLQQLGIKSSMQPKHMQGVQPWKNQDQHNIDHFL